MSGEDRSGAGGAQFHCHICSASLPPDATFCLQCGSRVRAVPPAPSKATIVDAPAPAAPTPAVAGPARHGTMMGVAPLVTPVLAPAAPPPAVTSSIPPSLNNAETIADMRPGGVASLAAAAAVAAADSAAVSSSLPAAVANKQRTMIGVAREGLALPPVATVSSNPPPDSTPPVVAPRSNTMMGVAPPTANAVPTPAFATATPPSDPQMRRRKEPAPFIGGEQAGVPPNTVPPVGYTTQHSLDDMRVPQKKPVLLWVLGGVLGLGLLAGAGVLGMRALSSRGPTPWQAEVRLVDGALRVRATLPGADARWRVTYRGTAYPVDASGATDFPPQGIGPDDVGDVVLPIEVRDAAGATTQRALRIVIGYRVTTDLDHLGDPTPRVHLRFRVPSGATLSIAGQPITLAGQLGVAEIPAPAAMPMESAVNFRSERFPIEVRTATGVVIRGEYELRVPRLPLRVETPGPLSLVNAAMVTVEGSLPRATRVLVGAQPATLMGDHFRAEVPIAAGANSITVQGFAPGGAPATATVAVYRSITPQDYLASGGGDHGLAPLVTPSAATVRLKVRGRVINSTQAAGELPTFQLLVSDHACPNQQCLAWVDMAPGSLARVNETVEVVGETHGTRSYVTQGGQRRTDAVIRALFVLRP